MDDTKIVVAIIAATVSLIIGILNITFSLYKQKKDKEIFNKQEELSKELESIKAVNQKQLLEFQQSLNQESKQEINKINKEKSILQSLQLVKDSMYYFKNLIRKNGNSLLEEDITQLKANIFSYINSYKSYYMNMNEYEKDIIHSLKNEFHQVISDIEVKQRLNKISESNTEAIVMLNNCIIHINDIQKDLIKHYGKEEGKI